MFVCKHDENKGLCECGYVIRVLILFYFRLYLIRADVCLSTVQISNASQKLKKKQAEVPHMFELSFKKCERV